MTDEQLGELVFERRPKGPAFWISHLICLATLLIAGLLLWLGLFVESSDPGAPKVAVTTGIVVAGLGAALVAAWWITRPTFRCHRGGIVLHRPVRERRLLFEEVETVRYHGVRMHTAGGLIYSHTNLKMFFMPGKESGLKPIVFSVTQTSDDQEVLGFFQRVTSLLAERLQAELEKGSRIPWGGHLAIRPEGFEYRSPKGLIGLTEPAVLPFAEISHYRIEDAVFEVYRQGQKKPIAVMHVSEPNFFPVYELFKRAVSRG